MLPAVPSTTVPPGFNCPSSSAFLTTYSAALSLTLPPGFWNSALPRTLQPVSSERRFSRTSGVLPIARRSVRMIELTMSPQSLRKKRQNKGKHTFCEAIDNALSFRYTDAVCIPRFHLRCSFSGFACRCSKSANAVTEHNEEYSSKYVFRAQY